ncbi:MAG: hypothetical protein ACPLYC_01040 [Minisyncoccia bacterium]
MTNRQSKLLKAIINQYIKTAEPISSEQLTKYFDFSSATIRHEMAELIKKGYLYQPHISAGRIPTEKAYQYYIENFLEKQEPKLEIKKIFRNIKRKKLNDFLVKLISKRIAESIGQLTIFAFNRNSFYYTGLFYLFEQPEFRQIEIIYDVSQIIDHLDKITSKLFDKIGQRTEIFLGQKNPFGEFYSTIFTRVYLPWEKDYSLFGLLGPMRMDYSQNLAVVNYIRESLSR